MTETTRPIVTKALEALAAFEVADADGALLLLSMWRHRGALTVEHIREILTHVRVGATADAAPATPAHRILHPEDGAPEGAVKAIDRDDDEWRPVGDGERWESRTAGIGGRAPERIVRLYCPVHWYDAADRLIATSYARDPQ